MSMTRRQMESVLGPIDETLAAQIVQTGVDEAGLLEAKTWIENDEALVNEGRPFPTGSIASAIAVLKEAGLNAE